ARWGLVPPWAESPKVGGRMINARAEGLADKSAWRRPFATGRRCLVAADGFYEWRSGQAYYAHRPDGGVLAFAGLWETWRPRRGSGAAEPEGELVSCAIVTTVAGEDMAPVHDRMPAVLAPGAWDGWLDPANDDLAGLAALLGPLPPGALELTPVGPRVGNVANDGPDLIEPVPEEAPPAPQMELFPPV
ncbi:MAG: SOS response-associated peptidase, partial [Actinomycetota bacterium]|nr:SOS response-associated peptidase [Actinomycetota bacterium]